MAVDTSVLVDVIRRADTPAARAFARLADAEILVIGDIVLLEVLQGSSSERRAREAEAWLRRFEVVAMLDDALAAQAAAHCRRLRGLGVTPRSIADLVIASWCIAHAVPLLQRDRDFALMAEHLGLQLVAA
ncbi:type II toxin-antitoxin system VapC family toxin [Dankookia rubra]|uniref:type II toxin-antitoxin system VapC family toxin n=1 Tax=Dankookia rubra TaxID=1442381 RepID=UPI00240CE556|nr:PIN domain-containing protein [Dankookia rubra]